MHSIQRALLTILLLSSLALAQSDAYSNILLQRRKHGMGGGGEGGGPGPSGGGGEGGGAGGGGGAEAPAPVQGSAAPIPAPSVTATSLTPITTSTPVNGTSGKGDTQCATLLCVSALVNSNSTVTYVLQSTGAASLGWMAIGFGVQMVGTPMVIMWPNSDGSITLSQRQASAQVMPTVVSGPPRVASTVSSLSSISPSSAQPKLAFSIPSNSDTLQDIIWAFASATPSSSAVDATIQQHLQSGTLTLDLTSVHASSDPATTPPDSTTTPSGSSSGGGGGSSSGGSPSSSGSGKPQQLTIPLLYYEKLIIAHAIFVSLGFAVFLPIGVFVARFFRLVTPKKWFRGHAYIQFWISGPIIVSGVILGIISVSKAGAPHLNDRHKVLGIVIFVAYIVQCSLGAIIHWVKNPNRTSRPFQNYAHAVFGLAIIGLSLYQIRLGTKEWPTATGRGEVPKAAKTILIVWYILLPVIYAGGLLLLRKQFDQETMAREAMAVALPEGESNTPSVHEVRRLGDEEGSEQPPRY